MKTHTMTALMWKDYRLIRWILLGAVGVIVLIYGLLFIQEARRVARYNSITVGPRETVNVRGVIEEGFNFSPVVCTLLLALIPAKLATGERADRSDRFMSLLPPTRRHVLGSKLLWMMGLLVVTVSIVFGQMVDLNRGYSEPLSKAMDDALPIAATWFLIAAGAWAGGWLTESPAIGFCCGFLATIIIGAVVYAAVLLNLHWNGGSGTAQEVCAVAAGVVGVGLFALGNAWALRRPRRA